MLTSDLLLVRRRGPYIEPRYVDTAASNIIALAEEIINIFTNHQGKSRGELHSALDLRAAEATDYRVQRGLTKLLGDDRCEFRIDSIAEPEEIRTQIFGLSRENHPIVREPDLLYPVTREHILDQVALKYQTSAENIAHSLYADLSTQSLSRSL